MLKRNGKREETFINIEASMTGNLKFNSPVNLKISGKFEGELETEGTLIIGEEADVKAKIIKGENITVLGTVKGDIVCSKRLQIFAPAKVTGNIQAPILVVNEGAMLKGHCQVPIKDVKSEFKKHPEKKE
ncbi:MAG: polymer-forming cytoskeletal protein [bacterium]|nr:polymer-forming cytoskeletal protein [Candidatus Omnitrophota bacterium]MBU1524695.1 polymer-forming cytoskeletal protein [Candidatus Omnitrophota bacterium]